MGGLGNADRENDIKMYGYGVFEDILNNICVVGGLTSFNSI